MWLGFILWLGLLSTSIRKRITNVATFKSVNYRWQNWRLNRRDPLTVLTQFLGVNEADAQRYLKDYSVLNVPRKKAGDWTADDTVVQVEYLVCRAIMPELVLETGVNTGRSSLVILNALKENGKGRLVSIDLPSPDRTREQGGGDVADKGPGQLVPETLRKGWDLRLGDARQLLPESLEELGSPDLFIHDSDHSYDHMLWELKTAAAVMKPGGLLMADDLQPVGDAFTAFSEVTAGSSYRVGRLGIFRLA